MRDAKNYDEKPNPQYLPAPDYFQIYLEKRPSELATKALDSAFGMWGNLKGVSEKVQEALTHISYQEDVWDKVEHGLRRAFSRDDRFEEGRKLLEHLEQRVVPLKSRSALLDTLAENWLSKGEMEKARQAFE